MLGKFRIQLLFVFFIFAGVNIFIVILFNLESDKKYQIEVIEDQIHSIELLIFKDAQIINNFFTYETRNSNFFQSHNSIYLAQHEKLLIQINTNKEKLLKLKGFSDLDNGIQINNISSYLDSLKIEMDGITDRIYLRGFKDFGMEGDMRDHAHNLENSEGVLLSDLLMLRRHEKDYIIRNEKKYIILFHDRLELMKSKLTKNYTISFELKKQVMFELISYETIFNKIVEIDSLIGIKDNTASKKEIDTIMSALLLNADILNQNCRAYKQEAYKGLRMLSIMLVFGIIGLAFFLSLKLSKRITKRLSLLSENISEFIGSCFTKLEFIQIEEKDDEVGLLIKNFELLKLKIHDQINYLEVKVQERTEEINIQKEHILSQNKRFTDSLRSAMSIQEAMLPDKCYIAKSFPEHFIYFRPKDIVSGDFYWFKRIKNDDMDISVIAIVDCTGHGVPGAFMSMLGMALLNDIIIKKDVYTTANILNKLRKKVINILAHHDNSIKVKDGMDVALTLIDHKTKKLQFSGANRNLIRVRNNQLEIIKGDKMPIGKFINDTIDFTYTELDYFEDDIIYMFTDGFADQFGGKDNSKYLRKNLLNFLLKISPNSMETQKQLTESELNGWMCSLDQTDDILLTGFKLKN